MLKTNMGDREERLIRRITREKKARKEAETLLEKKALDLYETNQDLKSLAENLSQLASDLVEKEQRSRSILEAVVDGVVTIDEQGIIKSFNRAASAIFGYSVKEAVGLKFKLLLVQAEENGCLIDQIGKTKKIFIHERMGCRSDGTSFPMDVSLGETELSRGKLFIAVIRDISARKKAEEEHHKMELQLRQAQKLESIGQLAAGIAHEINTPTQFVNDNTHFVQEAFDDYNTLLTAYEQLLQIPADNDAREKKIKEVKVLAEEIDLQYLKEEVPLAISQSLNGLERIAKIVHAMKEFSHPGADKKIPIDINRAIKTTIDISRNEWKYQAEMETNFDSSLPLVPCLPDEINQVFLNLIVNASHAIADFIGKKQAMGKIIISTLLDGDWVEITVSDTGCGIPEDIQQRIFDPFFTTKDVGKGTGQGLAITYSIVVDKHGGTITLESKQDEGTVAIVRLPIKIDQGKSHHD